MSKIRFLSVCSGIEAASQALIPLGFVPVGFAEIDRAASRLLAYRHGANMPGEPLSENGVPNFGDFTQIDVDALPKFDVLVGGTPCQDFSIAGLRAGLDGDRGNLTLEFLRLAARTKPEWIIWENVPGVLSDKTEALPKFLDGLQELGYVIDIDILDAQYFGLAQRRRRVFVCAQRSDAILAQRTITSALTISQCLLECLRLTLAVARGRSATGFEPSPCPVSPSHSLQQRMKLFALDSAATASNLRGNLAVLQAWSEVGRDASDWGSGSEATKTSEDTSSQGSSAETEAFRAAFLSIEPSWNAPLDDILQVLRSFTTSTDASATTELKIFTCSQAALRISNLITQSMDCSPVFWSAASSALTTLREFTSYARSASSDLFADMEWVHSWSNFIRQAEPTIESVGNLGVENFGKILPVAQGLHGNSAPRRKRGQDVAGSVAARTDGGGGIGTDGGLIPSTGDISHCLNAVGMGRNDYETETLVAACEIADTLSVGANQTTGFIGDIVANTLRSSEGFDASEDGTGRGTPIVPVAVVHAVAYDMRGRDGGAQFEGPHDTANIRASNGGSSKSYACVPEIYPTLSSNEGGTLTQIPPLAEAHGTQWAVRRLTPAECEILMGFPPDWTAIPGAADGPRYRQLGNSMAVPVISWLGQRLAACLDGQ